MKAESFSVPGFEFALRYDEVSSTMDAARELANRLASQGSGAALVCARRQTAGRGRQGRSWSVARKSFMGTYLLRTDAPPQALSGYSLAVGCAVSAALEGLGASVRLKWPNDVVVVRGDRLRKLGGILVEVHETDRARVLLVGIGVNLEGSPEGLPEASSVLEGCGVQIAPESLEGPLSLAMLEMHHRFVSQGGFSSFEREWSQRSCFVAGTTEVSLDLGARTVSGTYQGLDGSGAILLQARDGLQVVHSGHVVSLRGLR